MAISSTDILVFFRNFVVSSSHDFICLVSHQNKNAYPGSVRLFHISTANSFFLVYASWHLIECNQLVFIRLKYCPSWYEAYGQNHEKTNKRKPHSNANPSTLNRIMANCGMNFEFLCLAKMCWESTTKSPFDRQFGLVFGQYNEKVDIKTNNKKEENKNVDHPVCLKFPYNPTISIHIIFAMSFLEVNRNKLPNMNIGNLFVH